MFLVKTFISKISPNAFTKDNATFLGWSLDPDGDVQFQSGQIHYTNKKDGKPRYGAEPGDVITLYAIWDVNPPKDGYYKISGSSADGGPSKFFHSETLAGTTTKIADETKDGTAGETFTGIYYVGDDVEFNKSVNAGSLGNTFKYPETN